KSDAFRRRQSRCDVPQGTFTRGAIADNRKTDRYQATEPHHLKFARDLVLFSAAAESARDTERAVADSVELPGLPKSLVEWQLHWPRSVRRHRNNRERRRDQLRDDGIFARRFFRHANLAVRLASYRDAVAAGVSLAEKRRDDQT